MDWAAWSQSEEKRNLWDRRVQAIRCSDCHRLRSHPTQGRMACACGGLSFVATFPHPDEEQIAMKLYAREIEERDLFGKIAQQLIAAGGREIP